MWHTILQQTNTGSCILYFGKNANEAINVRSLTLRGQLVNRIDYTATSAIEGSAGMGSVVQEVWIERMKCGWWVGGGSLLTIKDCRIRNTFADGVNFYGGVSSSVVVHSHFRNTGDDAIASWSSSSVGCNSNNKFINNTIEMPWRANGIAIYGGINHTVIGNIIIDRADYPGILIAKQFDSYPFKGTTLILNNKLIRCGGIFGDKHGAFSLSSQQGHVTGVDVRNLIIIEPTYSGIYMSGSYAITGVLDHVMITFPGDVAIRTVYGISGNINCSYIVVKNATSGGLYMGSQLIKLKKIKGNSGW
jgi:hypothetical protein